MFGKILGAMAGRRLAGPNSGLSGAILGAAVPVVARRGLGPLSLALGGAWVAKKLYDRRQKRRSPHAPSVSPAS